MGKRYSLISKMIPGLRLRMIDECDQDHLREWKNQHRQSFFFRGIILPAAQLVWFEKFLGREHDMMFIVEAETCDIGCMGIRLVDGRWDIYNVILGLWEFASRGLMGRALQMMCSYAISLMPVPVTAKVLSDNPALGWYIRNSFLVAARHGDHVEIALDRSQFDLLTIEVARARES